MLNFKIPKLFILLIYTFLFLILFPHGLEAATNISDITIEHYAWNDLIGWIDFYITDTVYTYSNQLKGYASSSVGYIALNCDSTPNGNICAGPAGNWKVSNDGNGNLSGWAWNDGIGWISFDSVTAGSGYTYQVTVNSVTGDFSGWAWNDNVGWISFNCNNAGIGDTCGTSKYKVRTDWAAAPLTGELISSIFDTQIASGTALNSIMWQGNRPTGTNVKFQIASSNSIDTWVYRGPDGLTNTYYTPDGASIPVQINLKYHNNHRYFRYKIFIESDKAQTKTPRVDDVIINWSP